MWGLKYKIAHEKSTLQSYILFVLFVFSSSLYALAPQTATLTVTVEGLRNSKGVIQFSLYNKDGSIPDEHYTQYFRQQTEIVSNARATTVFKNLPIADYAINILHDENMNGKIDKGFVLPIEGIGFSRYTSINLFNQPNFKGASIRLNEDVTTNIKVIYF